MNLPAGLALVDVDETESQKRPSIIPSSAYRKLLEALWYLGERPPPNGEYPVVDLGACPGGWTGALRKMGCKVIAVDRSELAPILMQDEDVEYVQVDAFRFVPPWARTNEGESTSHWPGKTFDRPLADTWMVSDIIAYPDKIAELLDHWCGKRWVSHAIVTIKFQSEVPWEDVESAIAIVEGHGYACRTVHFFNNKHEVTLLAVRNDGQSKHGSNNLLGKPMYSPILPKPRKN
jgi:23S rRNA (cytidine2498-2'-O)-methyltransferase